MAIGEFKKAQNNFCLSDFSKKTVEPTDYKYTT